MSSEIEESPSEMSELDKIRHSLAHIMAGAIMELYPNTQIAIGPVVDNGFYYDLESDHVFTPDDFKAIEKKMKHIVKQNLPFEEKAVSKKEALKYWKDEGQKYKVELIEGLEDGEITFYTHGKFTDLCRGGHLKSTGKAGVFKLDRVAGAYWRGDENNQMLQRIYGLAFANKEDLDEYLALREEAKKRDHRKLGKELDLFAFSELVGPGLPLFTPRGTIIRDELEAFVWSLMKPHGYARVRIPHMAKADLYKTSGHYEKFTEDIFEIRSKMTDEEFIMKPMNCPHHTQIYASQPRSYRDLPLRYSEVTQVYRDENTGQLQGLSRVRSITQDDAHVFCRMDQVEEEALKMYDIIVNFYKAFDMPLSIRLSTHDPEKAEKYLGDEKVWEDSVGILEKLLKEMGVEYFYGVGEAAFYGPKIDFIATDALGREWQLATIQLDFNLPERFKLEYADQDGSVKRPVMVHRAVLGSVERFMAILIEHFAGNLPVWLAPEQVRLIAVSEKHTDFVKELETEFLAEDIRVGVDISDNTVGKKIRESEKMKIPYSLVIGDKEKDGAAFAVRKKGEEDTSEMSKADFFKKIKQEIDERSL